MSDIRAGIRLIAAFLLALICNAQQKSLPQSTIPIPRFEDYSVAETLRGTPAAPLLITREQRLYRTRIRRGVSQGEGVWNGSWKSPIKNAGPNFAGHYYVIRWGCGSNCMMMAIVDATTGRIYNPPLSGVGTELYVSMDQLSDKEIDFQPNSSLMILRNACTDARKGCGVYYFNWQNNKFALLKRTLVDLTGDELAKQR